jgi:hypothetical protein
MLTDPFLLKKRKRGENDEIENNKTQTKNTQKQHRTETHQKALHDELMLTLILSCCFNHELLGS